MESLDEGVSISEYDFLVFETREVLVEFTEVALASTHAELQDYLNELGFTSLGHEKYENNLDDMVSENNLVDYLISSDSIL